MGAGHSDLLLDGVLEHLVLLRDVLAVIDLLKRVGPGQHIPAGSEGAALIDGGGLAVGFKVKIIPCLFRQFHGRQLIYQPKAVFLRVLDGV